MQPVIKVIRTYPQTKAEDLEQAFNGEEYGERRVDVTRNVLVQLRVFVFFRNKALRQNAFVARNLFPLPSRSWK